MGKQILMVVTNHTDMQEGKKTGIWLSEFAEAYLAFQENGYEVTVASPKGGAGPIDPGSVDDQTPQAILDAAKHLEHTRELDEVNGRSIRGDFPARRSRHDVRSTG